MKQFSLVRLLSVFALLALVVALYVAHRANTELRRDVGVWKHSLEATNDEHEMIVHALIDSNRDTDRFKLAASLLALPGDEFFYRFLGNLGGPHEVIIVQGPILNKDFVEMHGEESYAHAVLLLYNSNTRTLVDVFPTQEYFNYRNSVIFIGTSEETAKQIVSADNGFEVLPTKMAR